MMPEQLLLPLLLLHSPPILPKENRERKVRMGLKSSLLLLVLTAWQVVWSWIDAFASYSWLILQVNTRISISGRTNAVWRRCGRRLIGLRLFSVLILKRLRM